MEGTPDAAVATLPAWRAREQQALDELGVTRFSPGVPAMLLVVFLAIILAVPVLEAIGDYRANVRKRAALIAAGADHSALPGRRPRVMSLLELLPSAHAVASARSFNELRSLLPRGQALRAFEEDLSLNSPVGRVVRPRAQGVLTNWLGVGNQSVLYGRDGWLYYDQGVLYAVGPGFLDELQLAKRNGGDTPADPRPAIVQLHRELKALGVLLVVLPVPEKAVIHPGPLLRHGDVAAPIQNVSWNRFMADLGREGVLVVDITTPMFSADSTGTHQFLRGNAHWTPEGMELAARAVADSIRARRPIPSTKLYARKTVTAVMGNDLAIFLGAKGPGKDVLPVTERRLLHTVIDGAGQPWKPDSASDILVIGDSFLEMYTELDAAHVPAGLAEQLSYLLQRPVDRRANHIFAQFDVREALGLTLRDVRAESSRRKVVVFEFAARKLAVNHWPLFQ